jgi:hypothetical protein
MISSLKSRFDLSEKRAVCIAGDRVIVYHWHRGRLAESYIFTADESGRGQFTRYLIESPNVPVYLLVDAVEEEYRQDTIPHTFGRDRNALLARKYARLFRGAKYCHALFQGREPEGRRDDRVLLTALTNAEVIAPWLDMLAEHRVPLAGIYSLPLASESLLDVLECDAENVLLVTMQNASGLRQTFFRGRDFKISRLAKMPRLGTVPYANYLLGELEKLRRYLNSLRLMSRDAPLDVYILSQGALLDDLKGQCHDTDATRFHLFNVESISAELGIGGESATPYCDRIFAHLLLDKTPRNHYAAREHVRYYSLHRARIAMLAASVLLVLGSAVWSGFNFIEGVSLKQQALDAEQKADFYQARYDMARQSLPPTPVEPRDVQIAVDIADTLTRYKANPLALLQTVSNALDRFPAVRLEQIEWMASMNPAATLGEEAAADSAAEAPIMPAAATYAYYQIGVVEARLDGFDGDYRQALAEVNRFAETLRAEKSVERVSILSQPLDLSSSVDLQGSATAGSKEGDAAFRIKLVMGVSHGAG